MSKREIIKEHSDFFKNLPLRYVPPPKPLLRERFKSKEIQVDSQSLDYLGEEIYKRPGGLRSYTRMTPEQLDFGQFGQAPVTQLYQDLERITGGGALPDECFKPMRDYLKYRNRFQHYKNPGRSIEKQMTKREAKKTRFIKKNITLDFK